VSFKFDTGALAARRVLARLVERELAETPVSVAGPRR
jgi:hypothetical protein